MAISHEGQILEGQNHMENVWTNGPHNPTIYQVANYHSFLPISQNMVEGQIGLKLVSLISPIPLIKSKEKPVIRVAGINSYNLVSWK